MEIAPLAQLQQTQKLLEYVNRLLPEIMKEVSVFLQILSTAVVRFAVVILIDCLLL